MQLKNNTKYLLASLVMLIIAFIQCYRTIHDLHWAFEPDFDRDIGYIRNTLDGHFGTDPNYAGQYMWYNPMLFLSETLAVKLSGAPINVVVARVGAYLNLINPIIFFIMMVKLFDYKIATAALLSFLFLSAGNLPCWGVATYSPWMISDTFVQFIFYINIFLCFKAYQTQKMGWFIALGACLGISFLGHSAPTIIIILIMVFMQIEKIIQAVKIKEYAAIKTYIYQGVFSVIPFIICAFPFLYYVYGKYHLKFVNRTILECAPGIFGRMESLELIKANLTIGMAVAVFGAFYFFKKFNQPVIRKIVFYWLVITSVMYVYESVVPTIHRLYHLNLPDTIPAFHYFFYLKALQSVFFAFGFIQLFNLAYSWGTERFKRKFNAGFSTDMLVVIMLICALIYYPIYMKREDFTVAREQALQKENNIHEIEVYDYISKNVPLNNVLLCEYDQSLFPVMDTGIKMVSIGVYFSNPYISYDKRETDRKNMLAALTSSAANESSRKLFEEYKVNYILLTKKTYKNFKSPSFATSKVVFQNDGYTLVSLNYYTSNL